MAVLGFQLATTLIMISVIQKLGPHYSLARRLLCSTGLIRYLYPTNNELKQLANIQHKPKRNKSHKNHQPPTGIVHEVFHVPRNLDLKLDTMPVTESAVRLLNFYSDFVWLMDFTIYTIIVYAVTEIFQIWYSIEGELNLSMLWCILVLIFSLKTLLLLTIQYYRGDEAIGERATCTCMGFIYLLISMMVLIVDESTLELGLEEAYNHFNHTASAFLQQHDIATTGPASKLILKFCLAVFCGFLGALFTFPGLRIARMHWDLIRQTANHRFFQLLINTTFVFPLVLVLWWIKPLTRDFFTKRVFSGMEEPLLTDDAFDTSRILFVIFAMSMKLIVLPWYLQAYLDMAHHRVEEQKSEAGRITNIELQKKIAAVFCYLCAVALQYVLPIIMCTILALMYKTLGNYHWDPVYNVEYNTTNISFNTSTDGDIAFNTIFTYKVFRGLLGFSTWWCCFLYFASTSIGLLYQSYFSTS